MARLSATEKARIVQQVHAEFERAGRARHPEEGQSGDPTSVRDERAMFEEVERRIAAREKELRSADGLGVDDLTPGEFAELMEDNESVTGGRGAPARTGAEEQPFGSGDRDPFDVEPGDEPTHTGP